jgi:hypothetical protein
MLSGSILTTSFTLASHIARRAIAFSVGVVGLNPRFGESAFQVFGNAEFRGPLPEIGEV